MSAALVRDLTDFFQKHKNIVTDPKPLVRNNSSLINISFMFNMHEECDVVPMSFCCEKVFYTL